MFVDDDENFKAQQCHLRSKQNTSISYEINLNEYGVPLKPKHSGSPVEEITNIKTSLGNGICGYKLDNLESYYSQNTWDIIFQSQNGKRYAGIIYVHINDIRIKNETQYISVGDGFNIPCQNNPNSLLLNCKLYDPQGTFVLFGNSITGCNHFIETSKISDFGAWKCVLQFTNNMAQTDLYYNIIKREKQIINLWQNETNMQVNIGCSIKNFDIFNNSQNFCEMTRPDGEIFTLIEGLATDRYTALSTNISNGICGMEIKKPLEEFEKGLWRCEFKYVNNTNRNYPVGGFINLSNGTRALPAPEIQKKISTFVGEELSIRCRVPYSSSYCYMRGPDNSTYLIENNLEPTTGLCRYTKIAATSYDNGTWFCGFAKKTGEPDELYSFEVVVLDSDIVEQERKEVESTIGSTVYLKCSTKDLSDHPIQYCRFESNIGQLYHITPGEISTDRISYYGRGLEYGDCGIEIKNTSTSDTGPWTCFIRTGYNYKYPEINRRINLRIK